MYISNIQQTILQYQTNQQKIQQPYINLTDNYATPEQVRDLLAICEGVQELRINNRYLEVLPDLSQFTALEQLHLNCPLLTKMEEAHFPKKLIKFTLERSQMNRIPSSLWTSPNLNYVNINTPRVRVLHIPAGCRAKTIYLQISRLSRLHFKGWSPSICQITLRSEELTSLNESWKNVSNLRVLDVVAPLETVDKSLLQLTDLRHLDLVKCHLTDYRFVDHFKKLERLKIATPNNLSWIGFPDFNQLTRLNWLDLKNCCDQNALIQRERFSSLSHLFLENCSLQNLSLFLKCCPNLEHLRLKDCAEINLKTLLPQWSNMYELEVVRTPITDLPKKLPFVSKMRRVSLADNQLSLNSLEVFADMPALDKFVLHGNKISSVTHLLTHKTLNITHLAHHFPQLKFENEQTFLTLCSALKRSKISVEIQQQFVRYFANQPEIVINPSWDWQTLLNLSRVSYLPLRRKLQQHLDKTIIHYRPTQQFDSQSIVYVTGKPAVTKTKIREQLKTLGIGYAQKYHADVTHVLIGMNSADADLLKDKTFLPLSVAELEKYHAEQQPGFLQAAAEEESSPIVDNVTQLLQSDDPSTILVALEMIKTGGIPKGSEESVLLIQKTTADAAVRKSCRQLLEVSAPTEWLGLVRDRLSFKMLTQEKRSETAVRKQLEKLEKRTSVATAMNFALLLFKRYGYGLRYVLLHKEVAAWQEAAYDLLFKEGHFAYARGINYRNWRGTDPQAVIMYGAVGINIPLPLAALNYYKITSLDLSNCKFKKIKRDTMKFADLQKLDLAYNYLSTLPKTLAKFKELEEIDLSYNRFTEFPLELLDLPKLKKINLQYNHIHDPQRQPLIVPKVFTDLRPNCQVLT